MHIKKLQRTLCEIGEGFDSHLEIYCPLRFSKKYQRFRIISHNVLILYRIIFLYLNAKLFAYFQCFLHTFSICKLVVFNESDYLADREWVWFIWRWQSLSSSPGQISPRTSWWWYHFVRVSVSSIFCSWFHVKLIQLFLSCMCQYVLTTQRGCMSMA